MSMQMQQQEHLPPAYEYLQHETQSLNLPAVPTHAPSSAPNKDRLPGIRSLALPDASPRNQHARLSMELSPRSQAQWGVLPLPNGATLPRAHDTGVPRHSNDVMDVGSPMDTGSVASVTSPREDSGSRRETSVLSVDDPDVRLAAEALSGLGNPGTYLAMLCIQKKLKAKLHQTSPAHLDLTPYRSPTPRPNRRPSSPL
jgi:hypothetical protein